MWTAVSENREQEPRLGMEVSVARLAAKRHVTPVELREADRQGCVVRHGPSRSLAVEILGPLTRRLGAW